MVQFCGSNLEMLHSTHGGRCNIETEKSEQTVFAQISRLKIKITPPHVPQKHYNDNNKKLNHAKFLPLNIHVIRNNTSLHVLIAIMEEINNFDSTVVVGKLVFVP